MGKKIAIINAILIVILLGQILVESLFSFMPTIELQRFTYFVSAKTLMCALIPSILIWALCVERLQKVLSLTLVIYNVFRLLLEVVALISGLEWLVLKSNEYDYYGFTLLITSTLLSLKLNGVLFRSFDIATNFLSLLRKNKGAKKENN